VPYEARTSQIASRPIAAVRAHVKLSELSTAIPVYLGEVWDLLRKNDFKSFGRNVVIYYPLGHSDGDMTFDAQFGVEIDATLPASSRVMTSVTPGGTVAVTTHTGDYSKLGEAHRAIHAWCARNGHTMRGPNWEVYGHWTGDQSKAQTDVYYLLK